MLSHPHPSLHREQFFFFSAFFSRVCFFSAFFSKRRASRDVAAFSPRFLLLDREKVETFVGETLDFLFAKTR